MKVKHDEEVVIGEYQFADRVKEEVFSRLKFSNPITKNSSNVKASIHTEWDWEPENITFRNLKLFLKEEIERNFKPGSSSKVIIAKFIGCAPLNPLIRESFITK